MAVERSQDDLSLRAYLRIVCGGRGFPYRLLSVTLLWVVVVMKDGVVTTTVLIGSSLVGGLGLGFPLWRSLKARGSRHVL